MDWGVKSTQLITEVSKSHNSVIRIQKVVTKDDKKYVDIRQWYDKKGEEGCTNPGKGIWIPDDKEVLEKIGNALLALSE